MGTAALGAGALCRRHLLLRQLPGSTGKPLMESMLQPSPLQSFTACSPWPRFGFSFTPPPPFHEEQAMANSLMENCGAVGAWGVAGGGEGNKEGS